MPEGENKRGSRDNTDLPYKPEDAQNYENAPRGHLGAGGPGIPTPGLGSTSPSPDVTAGLEEGQAAQAVELPDQHDDPRPAIVETGDEEVDQFYSQDNRMVDQEGEFSSLIERKHAEMMDEQDFGDQDLGAFIRTDDPRPVFVETDDQEVDDFYAQDNRMVAQDTEFASYIENKYSDMAVENDVGDQGIDGQGDDGI